MKDNVQTYIEKIESDHVCVHPTDTLMGFTFNPKSPAAYDNIIDVKKRDPAKGFIMLASSYIDACSLWKEIPLKWQNALKKLWPGSLSVIFDVSDAVSLSNLTIDDTIAVRVPELKDEDMWYADVLKKFGPLPSTSINISGKSPLLTTSEIRGEFGNAVYIPKILESRGKPEASLPSTLIKITDSGYSCIREGKVSLSEIEKALK